MEGVVALIEGEARERIVALWEAFERETSIPWRFPGAEPHLSLHVAARVDDMAAEPLLWAIAAATPPFTLRTFGLGVFGGTGPTLWIGVTPSRQLLDLQARVDAALRSASVAPVADYRPGRWVPHITVAGPNVPADRFADALAWWGRQRLAWTVSIDNLSIGGDSEDGVSVRHRVPLGVPPGGRLSLPH